MADSLEKEIHELRSLFWSERDPDGRVFAPLADAYRRQGDLAQALELLRDGLRRHSDFAPALVVAGWVRRDRGETDAAREAFASALELDEENAEALRGIGELAAERGDGPAALEFFQRLVELEPNDLEIVARLREIEGEEKGAHQVEAEVDPVLLYEPPLVASLEASTTQEPLVAEQDELQSEEDEGPLTRTMADLYARQGLHHRALRVYRRLLEQAPDDAELMERVDAMAALVPTAPASGVADVAGERLQAEKPVGLDAGDAMLPGRPTDAEMETLARDWAEGPRETGDLSTPFAWTAQSAQPTQDPSGLPVREYFRSLLDWEPASPEQEAEDRPAVPIESLAPSVVSVASLAPEPTSAAVEPSAVAAGGPAVVPIQSLAPDIVDVATLAPDPPGSGWDESGGQIERIP